MKKAFNRGFTLIELLVVIAVLGILAAVVLVAINPQARIQDARNSGVRADIGQIATALEASFTDNEGVYPAALTDLQTEDQLKNIPVPPTGRTGCDETAAYGYLTAGGEAAVWADLEPCDSATETNYVYWTICGKAMESNVQPVASEITDTSNC